MYKKNALNRIGFLMIALVTVLMAALVPNLHASAALRKCRTDPIFMLSNGDKLTVTLDVYTAKSNIKSVVYILHVPAGVTVKRVVYTARGLGSRETYLVVQDRPEKTYTTDTVVLTHDPWRVPVVAITRLNSLAPRSSSGFDGDHLIVNISKRR